MISENDLKILQDLLMWTRIQEFFDKSDKSIDDVKKDIL